MSLLSEIESFFTRLPGSCAGDRLLIAFSGGPDSTALAWALKQLETDLKLDLQAIHIDHDLDADSRRRARTARELSDQLEIPCTVVRHPIPPDQRAAEGSEAAARRARYEVLEACRTHLQAAWVATAHHADDQIETVLIRLLYGTGIEGLAGIRWRQGRIVRPLLGLRRSQIRSTLANRGLAATEDPTNYDLGIVRNRIRQLVLPELLQTDPDLADRVESLATTASRARAAIERRLRLDLQLDESPMEVVFPQQALLSLPEELWPFALALVHREAGLPYPPSTASRLELARQLRLGGRIGCDCGSGWRWESQGDRIVLVQHPTPTTPSFAYTVEAPGECRIPELALRFRIRRGAVDAWMFRHSSRRAGLTLPLEPGEQVVVRNRRPGDRVRPLGCQYTRRLKDILIDRRVPRRERSRLPLLEVDSRVAWVPGVTIDEAYRVETEREVWIAELESL